MGASHSSSRGEGLWIESPFFCMGRVDMGFSCWILGYVWWECFHSELCLHGSWYWILESCGFSLVWGHLPSSPCFWSSAYCPCWPPWWTRPVLGCNRTASWTLDLYVIWKLTRFVSTFDGICATECYLLCFSKGTGTKAAVKELEKIDALFVQYVDKMEDNCIGWVSGPVGRRYVIPLLSWSLLMTSFLCTFSVLDSTFISLYSCNIISCRTFGLVYCSPEAWYLLERRQIYTTCDFLTENIYSFSMSHVLSLGRPDGIESLCQDLGIATSDIRILLLAW